MPRRLPLRTLYCVVLTVPISLGAAVAAFSDEPPPLRNFQRDRLVAWCVVPFDAARRGPAERAQMLEELGLRRLAYDWRNEHVAEFEAEILACRTRGIEFFAFWDVHDDAFALFRKHGLRPQIWKTAPSPNGATQSERVAAAAETLEPLARRTAELGCRLGLYNHGHWGGEPENLVAVCEALRERGHEHVGIVYNLHHGHDQLDRWPAALRRMQPYLLCLNLNGMNPSGQPKILTLGQGKRDAALLREILAARYDGPVGIIDHRQELDARQALQGNLDGLEQLLRGQTPPDAAALPPHAEPSSAPNRHGVREHRHHAQAADDSERAHGADARAAGPVELPPEFDPALRAHLAAATEEGQDLERGADLFANAKSACLQCHRIGAEGGALGPELTRIGAERSLEQLIESVLWPQQEVKDEFVAWSVQLADGRVLNGYKRPAEDGGVALFDPAKDELHQLSADEVESEVRRGSLMPAGLLASMNPADRLHLFWFLSRLGRDEAALTALGAAAERHRSHEPLAIAFDRAPLDPGRHHQWQAHVNRDRVYDYYRKQADAFRGADPLPMLLAEHPAIDGGKYGHWGNQGPWVWTDDRWRKTDFGARQSGVTRFGKRAIGRAVCVRLGDAGELSACFNPDRLSYEAVWSGGFVTVSNERWGFLDGLIPVGEPVPGFEPTAPPAGPQRYLGYYRYGPRTVFHYRIGHQEFLDAPWVQDGKFVREVAPVEDHSLRLALKGGPTQWPQVLETAVAFGEQRPYALDSFPPPFENPWNALLFLSGVAFLPEGDALVCTMQGDVWRVSGLDAQPDRPEPARWRRFASGLHQSLGLWIDEEGVFVQCRDQLVRLHDLNGDGEADYYECFSNAFETSPAGHDYVCGLERDRDGRFYFASSNQGIVRISADGARAEVLATGLRNPNGLGLSAQGTVTAPSSEGEWVPASSLFLLETGHDAFGERPPPHFGAGGPRDNQPPRLPLLYLPRNLDNSSGGQVFVDNDRWGLPENQLIHFSHGMANAFLILRDNVGGQQQGAACAFLPDFQAGVHRGRFRPQDGQLYVAGMHGWGCYGVADGCLQRVRYTGDPVPAPRGFHVHVNGVVVSFSYPLDPALAADSHQHFAQCWNYRYSPGYGSPEFSPMHPGARGHDPLRIASAHILPDGRSLFVEIPDLQPVSQLHLSLRTAGGRTEDLFITVHSLDGPFTEFPGYVPAGKILAAHPLLTDMATSVKRVPNPFQQGSFGARQIAVSTGRNLTFETASFTVRAGELIRFTLKNPDVVPHNWALVRPGTLAHVGDLANRLIADPEAFARHYIPQDEAVLFYTDVVDPGEEFSIFFHAPRTPGEYPYLCTFPGHWMIMNGVMIVTP